MLDERRWRKRLVTVADAVLISFALFSLLSPVARAQELDCIDHDGMMVNATLSWWRGGVLIENESNLLIEPDHLLPERYNVTLKLNDDDADGDAYTIVLENLQYQQPAACTVDDIPTSSLRDRSSGALDTLLVDLSGLEFSSAELVFVAKGIGLYKCIEFDAVSHECLGEHAKIMDTVPGLTYSVPLTAIDPLFSQIGYLRNPGFNTNTTSWTTLSEGATAAFSWVASDTPHSGVAQMSVVGSNKNAIGNYYQAFNLTVPQGTALAGVNFSASWRIPLYSAPGTAYLWIQDAASTTTYCSLSIPFSSATSWSQMKLSTGSGGCNLSSFSPNMNYTFRMRCNLNTANGKGLQESCGWDDASITVWYNDTTAPLLRSITGSPNPVNSDASINFTVNATDNIQVDTVLIEIGGTNRTMLNCDGELYYYDGLSTASAEGVYSYRIFANDTNGNWAGNASSALEFAINDVTPPVVTIISPSGNGLTSGALVAVYSIADYTGADACSLAIDGVVVNATALNPLDTPLNMTARLVDDGAHLWNITCNDTSGNVNASQAQAITVHTGAPSILLSLPDGSLVNSSPSLGYVPYDPYLGNCTLWGNWSGNWSAERTALSPVDDTANRFSLRLDQGAYRWNVQCMDLAGNGAFSAANLTFIVAGDVLISDILFSTRAPVDGQRIEIFANVTNNENTTEEVVVQFFEVGGVQLGNTSVMLGPFSSGMTSVVWVARLGQHDIRAIADPPGGSGSILEYDEDNNFLSRTLEVSIWQVYYGNITGGVHLDTADNSSLLRWIISERKGNVFITDSDTSGGITFAALEPIGRNTSAGVDVNTADDFEEIDRLLNTVSFADSVNRSYTAAGAPIATGAFLIYGKDVPHVPVINSSADGNFTVGLLWDASDSTNPYFDMADREDLIFITSIRNMTFGSYGAVDYEARIPAQLAAYGGDAAKVTLYYELQ